MKANRDYHMLDQMAKDPANWRGPFYFCRKDPRLIVPKIDTTIGSSGGSFNCANPFTYIIIIGIVLIAVFSRHLF
jgi:uncharacterized membrane protein